MCGGPKAPDQAKLAAEAAAERKRLETEAAQRTNSKLAAKNRSRAASSLMARPIDSGGSVLGSGDGKTTLGQ